jgi:predicted ATPase
MYKIPISGGPGTGKTTLFKALRAEFPDAYFVPEPATEVIEHEQGLHANDDSYVPNVPWLDYTKFGPAVADKSDELEAQIPPATKLVFQDRSLIDTIGYARLNDFDSFVPEVQRRVASAHYTLALFCEPVGKYATTHVRRETSDEAVQTHAFLRDAYNESGLQVIELPAVSVVIRLAIVHEVIANLD